MLNFTNFDLDEKILRALEEIGYQAPTPIQEQAIPKVLQGMDIIASAQTGTGKTAAFMLPTLHLLCQPSYRGDNGPQVLILVPTRELAMQVANEAKKFSKHLPKTKTVCIYGGVPYPVQKRNLAGRYEILVATPGRLMDLMDQNKIDLSKIKLLILDEADRMLDMGFIDAVEQIARATPKNRQTLMFSATIDHKILPVSKKLQNNAQQIKVEVTQKMQDNIEQRLYYVDGVNHKKVILEHLLAHLEINQSIIFTSTIQQTNELVDHLQDLGYASEALHGDMNQRQRTRTIGRLRNGQIQFLIATDVASRGIDIASLSHVINFDLPFQSEDFIHRIGRTGRAGATGVAITFTTHKEELKFAKIQKIVGKPIEVHVVEGMEPKAKEHIKTLHSKHRPRVRFKGPASFKPRGSRDGRQESRDGRQDNREGRDGRHDSRDRRQSGGGYGSPQQADSQRSFGYSKAKPRRFK